MNPNFFEHEQSLNLANRPQDFLERIGTQLHNSVAFVEAARRVVEEGAFLVRCVESSRGFESHPKYAAMKHETTLSYEHLKQMLDRLGALNDHRELKGPNGWMKPDECREIKYGKKPKGTQNVI